MAIFSKKTFFGRRCLDYFIPKYFLNFDIKYFLKPPTLNIHKILNFNTETVSNISFKNNLLMLIAMLNQFFMENYNESLYPRRAFFLIYFIELN